jgi:hypothetical protein
MKVQANECWWRNRRTERPITGFCCQTWTTWVFWIQRFIIWLRASWGYVMTVPYLQCVPKFSLALVSRIWIVLSGINVCSRTVPSIMETFWWWVRATRQKVAGSIPDGVIGIFHWFNPSGRTMTPGSTHPRTEMSTRNISCGVKAAGA